MAITYVEMEDRYKPLSKDNPVSVEVIVGDGQPSSGYLIFLDQKLKGANKKVAIGKPRALLGKRIFVSAVVVDTLSETNWTSITVVVTEGNKKTEYGPYSKEVAAHLDTISYIIKILVTDEI